MAEKQQSPNWENYKDYSGGFIQEGFPFDEGFPKYPYDIYNTKFELLLRSGEKCEAMVDDSRQYMAEGLEWLALTPTRIFKKWSHIGRRIVVAWREL